jgi:hypothetical protein
MFAIAPQKLALIQKAFIIETVYLKLISSWVNELALVNGRHLRDLFFLHNSEYQRFHEIWKRVAEEQQVPDTFRQDIDRFLRQSQELIVAFDRFLSDTRDNLITNEAKGEPAEDVVVDTGNRGYVRHSVESDGDCGYTAFGVTREQALQLLMPRIASDAACVDLLKPAIKEALLNETFLNYLEQIEVIGEELGQISPLGIREQPERYAQDAAVVAAFLDFDIREKQIDCGWAHPATLRALAHAQEIELHIWRLSPADGRLVPHCLPDQYDYSSYVPTDVINPQRLDLLFINGNHFERLEFVGYPQAISDNEIIYPLEGRWYSMTTELSLLIQHLINFKKNPNDKSKEIVFTQMTKFRGSITRRLTSAALPSGAIASGSWLKEKLGNIYFEALKAILLRMSSAVAQQESFLPVSPLSAVSDEAYRMAVIATAVFKPEAVVGYLLLDAEHTENKLHEYQNTLGSLRSAFKHLTSEAIRVGRIIDMHRHWLNLVIQKATELVRKPLIDIKRIFTQEKRIVYRKKLNEQKANVIVQDVCEFLEEEKLPGTLLPSQVHASLLKRKQRMVLDIQHREAMIQQPHSLSQHAWARASLSFERQLHYQMAGISVGSIDAMMTHTQWPIFKEELPPALKRTVEKLSGVMFVGVDLAVMHWLGSSYQFIHFANDLMLSQLENLFNLGAVFEYPTRFAVLPSLEKIEAILPPSVKKSFANLKDMLRTDEIGMLEKEEIVRWFSGLGINVGMGSLAAGSAVIAPTAFAYTFATLMRAGSMQMLESIEKKYRADPNRMQFVKFFTQLLVYSYSYYLGVQFGFYLFPQQTLTQMSEAEALQTFGFHKKPDAQEIQKRYHELAIKNHPDKCKTDCLPMDRINVAYGVLKKQQ